MFIDLNVEYFNLKKKKFNTVTYTAVIAFVPDRLSYNLILKQIGNGKNCQLYLKLNISKNYKSTVSIYLCLVKKKNKLMYFYGLLLITSGPNLKYGGIDRF